MKMPINTFGDALPADHAMPSPASRRLFVVGGLMSLLGGAMAAPETGGLPPADLGVDRKGDPVQVSDFAGKAVVVTFWATWCPYCLKELPILHNLQNKVGTDRLRVVAVNTEEHEVFRSAVRALEHLNVLHARDVDHASQDAYDVKGLPHMVIIGRDGRIVGIHKGYGESQLGRIAADVNRALAVEP